MVRGALSSAEVEGLAAAGDHLDTHAEEYWDERGQERNLLAVDPDNFLPLLTHPVTLPLVAQLMGPRLQLHTSQFLWRHPDTVEPDSPSHAAGIDATRLGWVSCGIADDESVGTRCVWTTRPGARALVSSRFAWLLT